MKKLSFVLLALVFVACEGDPGPMGPAGPPGSAGTIGQAFEVYVNFNEGNDYQGLVKFADYGAEALDTDIVTVYWFKGVDENTGNDIWQQLPTSIFFDDGAEFQYSFDHTLDDVNIYLTGDVNLGTLGTGFTQDQLFRVAILPVDYVESNNIDVSNMSEVMSVMGIGNKGFKKVQRIMK